MEKGGKGRLEAEGCRIKLRKGEKGKDCSYIENEIVFPSLPSLVTAG